MLFLGGLMYRERNSHVSLDYVATSKHPKKEDKQRLIEFERSREERARQRVDNRFPPIVVAVG